MAIAPVVIEFLAKGMPQVQQAFQSIHAAAVKAERAQQVEAEKTTRAVKKAADERVKNQIAAYKAVDRYERQARSFGEREGQRYERERIKSEERVAKGKIAAMKFADKLEAQARAAGLRAAEQDEKRRRAIRERSATMAGQLAARQAREEAAAAKHAERERYQAVRDRIDRTKQAEKDLDAWQRSEQRNAAKAADKVPSKIAGRNNSALGRVIETAVGTTVRGVGAGLNRAGNIAMGLADTAGQLGGGFSIADAVMGEKNLRKQAAVLSASTILSHAGPGSEHGRAFTTDEILAKAKGVGIEQGIDPSEVLAGYDKIKKLTGNLEKATQIMPAVAKISTATGADLATTSDLAANILAADPKISNEEWEKQLRIFTKQGIVGGVEVGDFAKYGSRITASAARYGGTVESNEVTLGAMAQMARQYGGATTPAEAMLGSQRFGDDVVKHAKDLEGNGIKVSDGKGRIRDAQSIILDMLSKTNGDVLKLGGLGMGARGVRPLEGAAAIYRNAGGGEKGLTAVKQEFAKYSSGSSKEEIEAANKRVLAESAFEKTLLELKIAAGEQLLPAFKDMLPALKELIPALVDAAKVGIPAFTELMKTVADFITAHKSSIESLAAHPIGTLIGYELTKSFAAAGLPALLRGLFAGAFGNTNIPGAGGGGGGSAANAASRAAGLVLAGTSMNETGSAVAAGTLAADDLAAKVRAYGSGNKERGISPEQAALQIQAAKGRLDQSSMFGQAKNIITGGLGISDTDDKAYKQYKADQALVDSKDLQRAISEAAAAGVREGVANGLKNNSGANGAGRSEPIINR